MLLKLVSVFVLMVCLSACGGAKDKDSNTTEKNNKTSTIDNIKNISKAEELAEEASKRSEELKKLQPISNEVLKSFFKEDILGFKRSNFSVQNSLGYAIGEATYKKDDTTDYKIQIYDCAGEMGSGFYSMTALTKLNFETENENGYEKTIDFMGTKAMKSFQKNNNHYSVSFITNERFWIVAESNNTGFENLEAFLKAFELEKLKDAK